MAISQFYMDKYNVYKFSNLQFDLDKFLFILDKAQLLV